MEHRSVALALCASLSIVVGLAPARGGEGEAPERWPIPPVPPNAYAIVRPNENPLVQPNAKVPTPPIVWEKLTVRPDHPRLFFNSETVAAVRAKFALDPLAETIQKYAEDGDPLASALLYQMTKDKTQAAAAINALLAGTTGAESSYIFDWTYDAMTDEQRPKAIERLWALVTVDRASGWPRPSPYTVYPDDPRPAETPPSQWPPFYNWTFHDQDWARKYMSSFTALIALAGHHPRAAAGVQYFWEYSLKDAQLLYDYLRDGSYQQGYYWCITDRIDDIVRHFTAIKTACGLDYVDPKKHPYLANVGRWLLYCSDPARQRIAYNYGDGLMVAATDRIRSALIASNSLVRDPHVQWLAQEMRPTQLDWVQEFFHNDPTLLPLPPTSLPLARAFPGSGLVVMRSSWVGDPLWASVRWADWFDIHCHGDVGSFTLYLKSPLAPDSGYYDAGGMHGTNYARRTVAHNTLTIRDPAATVELNDGCQRVWDKRVWSFAVGRDAWLYQQDYTDHGDLLAFETAKHFDYCAGEGAQAYDRGMVKEFTRQMVFLRAGFVVIFDRVETARPDLEKRWLLHTVGEPVMDGKVVRTEIKGHIEDFDARSCVSKSREASVMRWQCLLPTQGRVRRVGGAITNIPVSALVKVPRTVHRLGTGSRWLWTDPLIFFYTDPLTGDKRRAFSIERDRPTEAEYEINDTDFYLKLTALERGRVEEYRLKLADYPNIVQLVIDLGTKDIWHARIRHLPGYEFYNEGDNYAPSFDLTQWKNVPEFVPELLGKLNDHGSWRIEVYPPKPAARDYFFNVVRCTPTAEGDLGHVTPAQETADRAETTITLGDRTYVLTFNKTGKVGGHIRIAEGGKIVEDKDFVDKIVQEPWPEEK